MSNLTSSVPGAYAAFYDLIAVAGAAQTPPVPVMAQELQQYEPGAYICLGATPGGHKAVENHSMLPAALGSFAMEESYEFWGYATVLQGDIDPQTVLGLTWTLFQNVVMSTVVTFRGTGGQPVLGSTAPSSLQWIVPVTAEYTGEPGDFGGGQGGFQGIVEFGYSLRARITVP